MNKIIKKILFPLVLENLDLESKIWHRLIKVAFIIFMFFVFIISALILDLHNNIKNLSFIDEDKIKDDIENAQMKKITPKEFWERLPEFAKENNLDEDTAILETLKMYKELWYSIEWFDIDKLIKYFYIKKYNPELLQKRQTKIQEEQTYTQEKQKYTQEEQKEKKKYFIWYYIFDILKLVLILYITLLLGQFIYYKMFLYIIYWKIEK